METERNKRQASDDREERRIAQLCGCLAPPGLLCGDCARDSGPPGGPEPFHHWRKSVYSRKSRLSPAGASSVLTIKQVIRQLKML